MTFQQADLAKGIIVLELRIYFNSDAGYKPGPFIEWLKQVQIALLVQRPDTIEYRIDPAAFRVPYRNRHAGQQARKNRNDHQHQKRATGRANTRSHVCLLHA